MEKKIFNLDFNEELSLEGVAVISVVEEPAIESFFVALSKHKDEIMLSAIDDEKKLLVGPVLIPDMEMLRKDGNYIKFSKEVIRKSMETFFIRGKQNNSTLEHGKEKLSGMHVVESWIVEDKNNDKSNMHGLDVPVGTWMVSMKVHNPEVYQLAKQGKIKGFSIEGMFPDRTEVQLSAEEDAWMRSEIMGMDSDELGLLEDICMRAEKMSDTKEEMISFIKEMMLNGR